MEVQQFLIALGKNIKAAREAKMYQLIYMAQLSGIPEKKLAKIESGEIDIDILTMIHIAKTLDIDARELIDMSPIKNHKP